MRTKQRKYYKKRRSFSRKRKIRSKRIRKFKGGSSCMYSPGYSINPSIVNKDTSFLASPIPIEINNNYIS